MENATNSIEMQIDNFLEHFKISSQSSSDWGDTPGSNFSNLIKSRSRSSCLDVADLSDNDLERVLATNNDSQNSQHQYSYNQSIFSGSSILKSVLQQNVTSTSCVQNSTNQYSASTDNSAKIMYLNDALHIGDVADLLHFQHAIITGGKSRDGCPLIIFPDNNNFQYLEDLEYQKLLTYLTSVPSMQDADLGFQIIVDRRKDKWTAVKAVLLKISMFFPDIIHVVYVLRPSGFFQKAISEVSSKFFKEDFRFRLVICSTLEELHEHLEKSQLTPDMGGTLIYSHHEWIQQRISLEQFSRLTQKVSADLDIFIQNIHETEFPNSVDATQKLIDDQCDQYNRLKEEIAAAAKHGEGLLINMKIHEDIKEFSERTGNVSALERAGKFNHMQHHDDCRDYRRLLVQLEETERRFDEFFATHQNRLKLCLDLRKFEQNFRELQICLDAHVKTVSEMTEIGDSVARVEILMNEIKEFEVICKDDIDRAGEVIESGQQLIGIQGAYQKDVVQPKCDELYRMCDIINDRLAKRIETLSKNGELMERVEKANKWCQRGVELIASQHMEKCSVSADLAEQYLQEIQVFISSADEFQLSSSPKEFKNVFVESTTQETKALVTQVLERLNDVSLMCDKRILSLKKLALKPPRPVQTVTPEPAVPLQPPGLPPHLRRRSHHHPKEISSTNKIGNYRPQSLIDSNINLSKSLIGLKSENLFENELNIQNNEKIHQHHHNHQKHYQQKQQQHQQQHYHKSFREYDRNMKRIKVQKLPAIRSKSIPNFVQESENIIFMPVEISNSPPAIMNDGVIYNKNEEGTICNFNKSKISLSDENCKNKRNLQHQFQQQQQQQQQHREEFYLKQPLNSTISAPSKIPSCIIKCENSLERIKCKHKKNTNTNSNQFNDHSSTSQSSSISSLSPVSSISPKLISREENCNKIEEKESKNNITTSKKYEDLITITGNNHESNNYDKCNDEYSIDKNNKEKKINSCLNEKTTTNCTSTTTSSTTGVTITILNSTSKPTVLTTNSTNGNNLNDVQNFNDKNLVKTTTDKLLIMNSGLNNTVTKKFKPKSDLDFNLKNNENRKFNDLKGENSIQHQNHHSQQQQQQLQQNHNHHHQSPNERQCYHHTSNVNQKHQHHKDQDELLKSSPQHCVKIFVRNSSFSNKSISSDTNSASTITSSDDSERDFSIYDDEQTVLITSPAVHHQHSNHNYDHHHHHHHHQETNNYTIGGCNCCNGNIKNHKNNKKCILHDINVNRISDGSIDESCNDSIMNHYNNSNNHHESVTKLGCDGGIFWNNCFYSLESNNSYYTNCSNFDMMSDYQYYKIMKKVKTNLHDLRPRSVEGGIDSGVSMSSDSGCTDNDYGEQNKQDLESRRLKRGHVLHELLETERIYVTEMNSILKGYRDQMQSEEMAHLVPPGLQGKEDILFGNLHELYTFHSETFLKDLENCISTTELVALCFVQRRDTFYRLYSFYCQNIPRSERLRETLVDTHLFLHECQKKLGHKLPLGAYLLKPVQRITKYQLLLKDLLRFSDSGTCTKELQKALDCMLIVLKCVNDSMHQIAITGFPNDLSQQGELLLQDSFQVFTESKKDLRLRLKPQQRHIFLYQKAMLFCKQAAKATTTGHNKSTYQYKHDLKMSLIGLTESVRGDTKRFEVWLQGRQEVYTLQAPNLDIKNKWVSEIKRVLLNQLEELKGEKIKQYGLNPRTIRQTNPWDTPITVLAAPLRSLSCDTSSSESNRNSNYSDDLQPGISSSSSEQQDPSCGWSSDYSNSEDELSNVDDNSTPGSKYIALADYCAIGHSEVSMREGDPVELLKIGCAGWWFVKVLGTNAEGWTPAAYLEPIHRKSSRSSSRVE